jgi:hypothetical protein
MTEKLFILKLKRRTAFANQSSDRASANSTLATDSLRAQRNHWLDAASSVRRNPAGEERDA